MEYMFKDVYDFQEQYKTKEAREEKLVTMDPDEIMHLARSCDNLTAAVYYGKFARLAKAQKGKRVGKQDDLEAVIQELEKTAYGPYDSVEHPTMEEWQKSYDALKELCRLRPDDGFYPNTLGYLCYYGRHTGGERQYEEAREWFEKGLALHSIESAYKLADMLTDGLGGPADHKRARNLYQWMYWYCRNQFESGEKESKFADTALRMGRMCHEGKLTKKNDIEALGYLLEAKYAIDWRKQFDHYGDDTVEKNILRLIDECEPPPEDVQQGRYFGLGLGRVPHFLLLKPGDQMTIDIDVIDVEAVRLEFRRKREDGKKPNRILWSVPPAMRCFMTDFVVLYGAETMMIWNKNPGERVICDRYRYDEKNDIHEFYLGKELQCKLMGGEYALAMDEFWLTEMRDHPEADSGILQ